MAVAFVQKASNQSAASSTSGSLTLGGAPASGSLLIFTMAGDKNTGAATVTGYTQLYELLSASVCLYYYYKVSNGTETTINFSWANSSATGNTFCYAEYDDAGVAGSTWQISGQASNITNESSVTSATSGTTGTKSAAGLGIAAFAVDSASNVNDGTTGFTNSYTARQLTVASAGGRGGIYVAEKAEGSGGTTSTTFSYTGTADQLSGAIAVWTKVAGAAVTGDASLAGTATLTTTGSVAGSGSADLAATGTLSATGKLGAASSGSLAAAAGLSATGAVGRSLAASLALTAGLTASGEVNFVNAGDADLAVTAALSASGLLDATGNADMAVTAGLTAEGVVAAGAPQAPSVWLFSTPTVDEGPAGPDPLFFRVKIARGVSVKELPAGVYTTLRYPTQDEIAEAVTFYLGGHIYEVADSVRTALILADIGIGVANFIDPATGLPGPELPDPDPPDPDPDPGPGGPSTYGDGLYSDGLYGGS